MALLACIPLFIYFLPHKSPLPRRKKRRQTERERGSKQREVSTVVPKLGVGAHVRTPEKICTTLIKQVRTSLILIQNSK
jgi:hypothetical protein